MNLRNILLLPLFVSLNALGQVRYIDYPSPFHPTIGNSGMVVSQNQASSDIGIEILNMGGNAIDAAVAVGFSLATTLPRAGNIGGGGFMLVYLSNEKKTIAVDLRSAAPKNLSNNDFLFLKNNYDLVIDNQKKTNVWIILISVVLAAIIGAIVSFLLSISVVPSLPIWNELKAAQKKSVINYDNLSVQINELSTLVSKIGNNIPKEVDILPIVNELEELSKKMQTIERYDFSQSDVGIKRIEALIDDRTKILTEDISSLDTKLENNISANSTMPNENAKNLLSEALSSMQNSLATGLPFQKALAEYEMASGEEAPAIIKKFAKTGLSTQSDLLQTFPQYARNLLAIDQKKYSLNEKDGSDIIKFLQKFVKTRSTSPQVGNSNDAILSRAEYSVKNGKIKEALEELDQLPLELQGEMSDWYNKAKNLLEIDNAINQLIYFHTD